mmetsp:Transcript_18506/g.44646  ORF Transcript_18506/g.44646 Transcript_18506/m.44646 type:complete len:492 (+) Transcript_18506:275-1750(+)
MVVIKRQNSSPGVVVSPMAAAAGAAAVAMRRRGSTATEPSSQRQYQYNQPPPYQQQQQNQRSSSFTSCVMGDDDSSSIMSEASSASSVFSSLGSGIGIGSPGKKRPSFTTGRRSSSTSSSSSASFLPSSSSSSSSILAGGKGSSFRYGPFSSSSSVPRWVLPALYLFTALSWLHAFRGRSMNFDLISALDVEREALGLQGDTTSKLFKEAQRSRSTLYSKVAKLRKTQRLFQHELRMIDELYEAEVSSHADDVPIPQETIEKFEKRKSANVAAKWIGQRQDALLHKIYNLQTYVQKDSYKKVIEKYGDGPYQVKFSVRTNEGRTPGFFIVELAPLHVVPHAIEKFLDMVSAKVWDNTVFYSHKSQSHVIAAAPVVYGTFQSKNHQLVALGHTGTSFPDYNPSFPHKRLTMGFAGNGPNFYINSIDNTKHHGPGGQAHHTLPTDADPCFGHIVSGHQIVTQAMLPGKNSSPDPKQWQDFDLTRIVKVELLRH